MVGVVSGSYSGPTRVTAPIFAKAGMPMVAGYAVHPDVTKAGESNFRNGFLGEVEGGAAGEYAVKTLKSKSPAGRTILTFIPFSSTYFQLPKKSIDDSFACFSVPIGVSDC